MVARDPRALQALPCWSPSKLSASCWRGFAIAARREAVLLVAVLALANACSLRQPFPPQPVVSDVSISGASDADTQALLRGLATRESDRFFGIWDGIAFEYEVYDADVLGKDLERIERYLQRRGYFEAKVIAARVITTDEHRVRISIRVNPGVPVKTASIQLIGLEKVPVDVAAAALRASPLRTDTPFDEDAYKESKQSLQRVLRDAGYAFAKVTGKVEVDVARHQALVRFEIVPGQTAVFGNIRIVGLKQVPEDRVRATLSLESGSTFSQSALDDAQHALLKLGVFTSVELKADARRAKGNRVPIVIVVDESELRTLRGGGGLQLDTLRFAGHLTVGWEDKNFLGGLRRFSIDAKPGMVFYPTRLSDIRAPDRGLIEQQLHVELRQPSLFNGRTTGFVSGSFSLYPLLYAESKPDEGILGFSEIKASTGLDRAFFDQRLQITPSYNWQFDKPVDYSAWTIGKSIAANDELLDNLHISYPELQIAWDLRDDPLEPRKGARFSIDAQAALATLGSDVSDFRVRPEARAFMPISPSVTLAVRAATGFLFPHNYGDSLTDPGSFSAAGLAQDQQKLLFRGFFSGGPNSNRGYPIREVGPHGYVAFLSRNLDCTTTPLPRGCNRPLGGVSLWEASLEVRFRLFGPLGGVLFTDASDVSRELGLSFLAPHLSPGWGLRYATPIGPVRFDMGYRLPFAQDIEGRDKDAEPRALFGLPIAIHLTLGEAF